jgi:hypothetical protein
MKKNFYATIAFSSLLIIFFSLPVFSGNVKTVFSISPQITINKDKEGAPSPIKTGVGVGFEIPLSHNFIFAPNLTFTTNYYLQKEDKVLPAEIENRTALAISSMINIPASFSIGETGLSISAGFAFFLRFALPLEGIEASDEVSKINEYFWQKMRFLYLSTDVQWMFDLPKVKAGPILRFYLPLGGLISDKSMNASIFNLGLKVCF